MPRAVDGTKHKDRRKKILDQAKGYWGRRSTNYRVAKDAVAKAGQYAYRGRREKKRDFRKLWIARISAAVQAEGLNYSQFMHRGQGCIQRSCRSGQDGAGVTQDHTLREVGHVID